MVNQSREKSKSLPLIQKPGESPEQLKSRAALMSSVNGASVIEAYQGNVLGKDVDLGELVAGLRDTASAVADGDLSKMEAMLISQATALQTIFTSLARRAAAQEHLPNYQTFLGLALKAQSQSRTTIQALAELKYPRQVAFVKQINTTTGPQQVNNGIPPQALARTEEKRSDPNEVLALEEQRNGRTHLDNRAAKAAGRKNQTLEALETKHRPTD